MQNKKRGVNMFCFWWCSGINESLHQSFVTSTASAASTLHNMHSHKTSAEEERHSNPLLQALKNGGALHKIVASAGSFDAVLCPTTEVLRAAGLDAVLSFHQNVPHMASSASLSVLDASTSSATSAPSGTAQHPATWLVLAHLIRFDNRGMSVDFSTLSGHRGAFSDALDSVFCAGVPGRSRVIRHLDPLPAQSQDAHRRLDATTLNIFLIDGIVVDEEVVNRCKQMLQQQLQNHKGATSSSTSQQSHALHTHHVPSPSSSVPVTAIAASHADPSTLQSPSTFSRLFGSVAGSWLGGPTSQTPPTESSSTAKDSGKSGRRVTTAQELAIQYPEFQRLISAPASMQVSKSLRAFVDRIVILEAPGKQMPPSSGSAEAGPSQVDDLAKEINGFTKQLVNQVRKIPHWKGYETVAREGIEKYICSKLYSKLFAVAWAEKQIDATLKRKIALLSPVVDIRRHLDGPAGVEDAADWASAVAAIKDMNEFRSPRDKMECIMTMCHHVQQCVMEATTKQHHMKQQAASVAGAVAGPSEDYDALSTSPPPSGGGAAAFGADDILPALMYCVLSANPENLHSNLVFIQRFRDTELMEPHGEYNLTCLQSCAQFWLTCQAHHLHMTEEAFDAALGNVYAKSHSKIRRGSRSDSPPPVDLHTTSSSSTIVAAGVVGESGTAKSSGDIIIDELFGEPLQPVRVPTASVDVQTNLSGSGIMMAPTFEQQRELPDHVVKVEDVLRCVVSMLSNELPGDIHASFDDLTVNDLRAAWVELQDLRVMRHKILELCGNTAQ
jgi:hypothetical protein